ncbi:MAG: Asp-tRNA(Asn)/Glu-tRNA(Gln) amidotransferase subunit GatC [Bavariicoccus seileri]|uniref:Asp-tRNA(Asn)/Glu-tRNA(Gln) amidotransferase subunit GatC n=1 Tax=Bavariicoccus seileri TaxID=549685 RepID=UPI0003B33981|nr:Asp-tRNA(Asn)/Glu-tRNA(Gln) amidotransferase subunit GatC [Bavariicoccus seileri]
MKLTQEEIRHVAELARLAIGDDEIELFTEQMQAIINMVEELEELDTTNVEPTTHGYEQKNIMREDVATQVDKRDELMKNVPTSQDGYIQVPAIMSPNEEVSA